MFNRLFNHLTKNLILDSNQFGFQKGHSAEHTITQIINQINSNFENNEYALDAFIDISKDFDTADHQILIEKLKFYGVILTSVKNC